MITLEEILADLDGYSAASELTVPQWARSRAFEWPPLTHEQAQRIRDLGR